ncbi:ATP-binding protein [Nostoc sp. UHCC 0702]|nr:ATP-binding protein [Nostoc sp. UHCC 0702]
MTQQPPVPRLNLAPKLKRPLSLWNPLDYLRLLYWVFFFPQALRWYVDTFGGGNAPDNKINWQNPIQRNLLFQGLVLILVTNLAGGLILYKLYQLNLLTNLIIIISFLGLSFGVMGVFVVLLETSTPEGEAESMTERAAVGVAENVAYFVALSLVAGILCGVIGSTMLSLIGSSIGRTEATNMVEVLASVIMLFCVGINVALGLKSSVAAGIALIVVSDAIGFVVIILVLSVVFIIAAVVTGVFMREAVGDLAVAAVGSLVVGVIGSLVAGLAGLRVDNWLVGARFNLNLLKKNSWLLPRITFLPLPNLAFNLQNWLQQDWEIGLHNTNQLLAYTLQFIPVVQAVTKVLDNTPSEQIIWRVSRLAEAPFDWNLLRVISNSLDATLKLEAMESINETLTFKFFRSWQENLKTHLLAYQCSYTPARAAAAGFWYLYEKKPEKAKVAFAVVRSLLYGEEMYILAQTLATFYKAKQLAAVATLEVPAFPQEPFLRPNVWNALISLRQVVENIQLLERSLSGTAKSLAFSHSLGKLTNILNTADTLPQAERGLIINIAQTWKDCLLQIAGEVGEISITEPVINPYVVGDPVQDTLFVGREDIIAQLKELWVTGNQLQSVVLYGHRRMGKTSILLNATQCLGSGIQLAYVNLLRLGDSPQGVGEVLIAISDEISEVVKLPPPADADLINLPYRNFERYLKQVTTQLTGGLIIALDEFEKIEDLINVGKIPQDFMGYLRGLVQMSPQVAFALAGLHTLEEMTADYFQPFFASVIPIPVGFQERAATRQILANPSEDFPLDYTLEALDEIYVLTYGQPYLVQLVGFQLVRHYNDFVFEQGHSRAPVFTVEDVEAVINNSEFFKRGRYYFDGVWGQAARGADGQQAILQLLAPYPKGLNLDTLAESVGLGRENMLAALDALMRHDVVEEVEGRYRIIVELFRRWILRE